MRDPGSWLAFSVNSYSGHGLIPYFVRISPASTGEDYPPHKKGPHSKQWRVGLSSGFPANAAGVPALRQSSSIPITTVLPPVIISDCSFAGFMGPSPLQATLPALSPASYHHLPPSLVAQHCPPTLPYTESDGNPHNLRPAVIDNQIKKSNY